MIPRFPTSMAQRVAQLRRDQVDHVAIVHSNRSRQRVNMDVRRLLGVTDKDPQPGEPMLVRRNNDDLGVVNGELLTFSSCGNLGQFFGLQWHLTEVRGVRTIIHLDSVMMRTELPPSRKQIAAAIDHFGVDAYVHAQLGYAMTAHAAQGSEWKHVVVALEPSLRAIEDEVERRRWVYTAVTRAREVLEVVT